VSFAPSPLATSSAVVCRVVKDSVRVVEPVDRPDGSSRRRALVRPAGRQQLQPILPPTPPRLPLPSPCPWLACSPVRILLHISATAPNVRALSSHTATAAATGADPELLALFSGLPSLARRLSPAPFVASGRLQLCLTTSTRRSVLLLLSSRSCMLAEPNVLLSSSSFPRSSRSLGAQSLVPSVALGAGCYLTDRPRGDSAPSSVYLQRG